MVKMTYKEEKNVVHLFCNFHAFVDSDENFFLIDNATDSVVRIDHAGCTVFDTSYYGSIEDFLENEFDTKVVKVYQMEQEYEIIING